MTDYNYRFTLKSTHDEAVKIPDIVDGIQLESSLSEDETSNFKLLLSEAVDNAIQHGNEYDPEKSVEVEIIITGHEIKASISNEGKGFDPSAAAPTDPTAEENLLNTSGRGIFLLQELADSLEFINQGKTLQFTLNR
ncbi:ATP-binding protein [Rhodohalobacter halophilus]|uniref:ATP-binding protein n=1 Tax=Rhodohalobacter halophilus TaxID=1812810 RepID=UPI00083FD65C|nr:ATP-binding protein [Rhodohalobacter halophilus]